MFTNMVSKIAASISAINFGSMFVPIGVVTFCIAGLVTYFRFGVRDGGKPSLSGFFQYVIPLNMWISSSTKVDIFIYIAAKIYQKWIGLLSIGIVLFFAVQLGKVIGISTYFESVDAANPLVVVLVSFSMVAFADLGEYISHYAQHRFPLLWEFHKVHHSATFLTPFTAYRFHPLGNLLDGICSGLLLSVPFVFARWLLPYSVVELLAMYGTANILLTFAVLTVLHHSHLPVSFGPLDRIFISPHMHQIHHSLKRAHWDKNFGSKLSMWDWLFGTGVKAPLDETLRFGVEEPEEVRLRSQYIWWCFVGPIVNGLAILFPNKSQDAVLAAKKSSRP